MLDADCAQHSGADDLRRCHGTLVKHYVDKEVNVPDCLAEEAVVI